jgi:CheY-like chemotaxis protein
MDSQYPISRIEASRESVYQRRTHDDIYRNSRDFMTPTVLLIDDNAIQAATRQTILKRAGYFVIAVLSPERALDQFRNSEFPAEINLIITDHIMPGLNGAEFVRKVREFSPDVPVLVISGMEEAEAEYEGLNAHFRLKPLLPDNLIASVHRLIQDAEVEDRIARMKSE